MDGQNNGASALAIAAATSAAPAPLTPEQEAERAARMSAAQETAAAVVKLSLDKLDDAIAPLDLYTLRFVLVAEEAKGDDARKGAVKMIEAAIDAHPEQIAALAALAPAPIDGGPMSLELPGDLPADADIASPITTEFSGDRSAVMSALAAGAGTPMLIDPLAAPSEATADAFNAKPATTYGRDDGASWTDGEVRAYVAENGGKIIIARRGHPHPEIAEIVGLASSFRRAPYGDRLVFNERIDISGVGLTAAVSIEEAWLVRETEHGPIIIRRCELASALTLEPGMQVAFPAGSLIF